jgi:hypothetical protein
MNRDHVHTWQLPIHRKVLNLKMNCRHFFGNIRTLVEYWTMQAW